MATAATAQEASSSISRCTYHVFLSFRGEDTRKNFTDHLYTALVQAGIYTFRDDDEIERGENIMKELQKAIMESKISIIVFSKDYASSKWCLDELVMIMELRKAVGLIVLPVFYDVDPSQVRKQTGSFAEAFARHEMRFKEDMDKVQRWRDALREVADLGGMVLGNRHESPFVQDIIQEIEKKLNRKLLHVDPYLVGIVSRVKEINLWVQDGSNDVGIAMIYGIGGIGKTTIAKTVYNMNFNIFQGMSFLGNVRETIKKSNGLVLLQRKLLSDILKRKTSKIYNADEGFIKIKNAICCSRVLLVLDDVDQLDQLNPIFQMREWFYPGSKIIITTRHERLQRFCKVCEKFKVKQMNDDESLKLFSWHAFGQGHPTEGYMECSRKVVHHCGGLPLALQVLGSSLYGRSIDEWEKALHKLEAIPDSDIQKILKTSYDSLNDIDDKNLFLDIACFFIGKDKDYTVGILNGCDLYKTIPFRIQNLIDRCLLTVNGKNKVMMHQLLRDMGREIIRQESTDDPGKRSRLWHHNDAFTVLKENTGTKTVKGLILDLHRLMEDKHGKTIASVNYAKRHHDQDYLHKSTIGNCSKRRRLSFFSWQSMNTASKNSFSLLNEVDLETKTFIKMHKLKMLQLNYVKLKGDYEDFPKNLIWLCWHGFPFESIPTDFCLEKLVALDMRYSSLKHVWRGIKFLAELKFLNLSHSHGLLRTPDFSGLPSLERLIFKDCINLVKVDESIGDLEKLVVLNLKECKNLRKLPRKIGLLKSLEKLILSGCSNLDNLPEDLGKMESLKVLHIDEIPMNHLLSTTRDTRILSLLSTTFQHSTFWSWNFFGIQPRKGPHSTSFSLSFLPHALVELSLKNCNLSDDAISYGLASLPSLQTLNLSGNPFHNLPESINGLTMLKFLYLRHCKRLQSLPEFPLSLVGLSLSNCTSLERAPYPPCLSKFNFLRFFGCESLVEVEGLFKLEPIRNSDIAVIKSLGLSNVESLGSIELGLASNISRIQRKTTIQVLHECDISSIFLPGSKVPDCFVLKNTSSWISFQVHQPVGQKICGLNLCTLYAFKPEFDFENFKCWPRCAKINNKTKHMRWTYEPMFLGVPNREVEDMLWLSHWKFENQLEDGDLIDILVVLPGFQVKMCGICFVYEPEDKGIQSNTEETLLGNFPWYNTLTFAHAEANAYFCCHHSYASVSRSTRMRTRPSVRVLYLLNREVEFEKCIFCKDMYWDN